VHTDSHKVCLYETMFQASFRLPFLPVVWELLHRLGLALHQIVPNAWRVFFGCAVLWPMVLGRENHLTVKEFLHLYRVQKNPDGEGVYNFQIQCGKLILLEVKHSSNH
jgi:hypothetical protein